MKLPTQPYKGARDFYPEDKRLQKYVFSVLRKVVEGYGYQEYDAPIVEPVELYLSKTSDEIVNEQTYSFKDRGDRNVTLRPEMTPSVSRMVAGRRQELVYPLRWYSIPNLWRYERPQKGRLREHYQLNVDLFGVGSIEGDHEVISIADSIMQAFGAKRTSYTIRLNSRKLMNHIWHDFFKLDTTQSATLIKLIDKKAKLPEAEFITMVDAILSPAERGDDKLLDAILDILKVKSLAELPTEVQNHPSAKELTKINELLLDSGISNAHFDITLMRGFDYYTDIVFEVFDTHPDNNRSMFGGGRYDGLVAQFGVEPLPTVGFGMGDVTLINFLESHSLLPVLRPETDVVVILIGDVYSDAQKVLTELRQEHVRVAVDLTDKKLDKKITSTAKAGVRYVLFIGKDELSSGQFKLKDLLKKTEEEHSLERIISILAGNHQIKENEI